MKNYSLPFKNIIRKPGRNAVLLIVVAFLSFSVFAGSLTVMSLKNGFESLQSRLGADVIVIPDTARSTTDLESLFTDGTPGQFYMKKELADKVNETDGIEQVSPQYFLATVSSGCCSVPAQIIGLDYDTDFVIRPWISSDYKGSLGDGEVIIGSKITPYTNGTVRFYNTDCKVVAQLKSTGTGLDTAVYTNIPTIRRLIQASVDSGMNTIVKYSPEELVSAVYIKVKDGYNPQDVADDINIHVKGVSASGMKNMFSEVSDNISGISGMVLFLMIAMWIVAFIILILVFSLLINERKKEFAVMRVVGMTRKRLAGVILSESLIICAFGAAIGIGAGAVAVFAFSGLIKNATGMPYLNPGAGSVIAVILITIGVTLIVGPLSSAYSAYRLSRADTGMILREGA